MNIDVPTYSADTVAIMAQLGRFDLVSRLLAIIGILLVFGGVFAYFHYRHISEEAAIKTAEEIAEKVANEYLQKEFPAIVEEYRKFLDTSNVLDEDATEIAADVDDDSGGKS